MKLSRLTVYFLLFVALLRGVAWFFGTTPLYPDEAQYWIWSHNLDFGYYSKPPMIAWLIALGTKILGGDSEHCLRLISLITNMFTAVAVYHLSLTLLKDSTRAIICATTFYTLASIGLASNIISTDSPLLLFAALHLLFFAKALETNKIRYYIAMGVFGGLGLLTKYNYGVIFIGNFLYLTQRYTTSNIKGFTSACLISLCLLAPNMYWNLTHDFVSIKHAAELTGATFSTTALFALKNIAKFFGDQFVIFSPVFLLFGLPLIIKHKMHNSFLLTHALSALAVVLLASIIKNTHGNWAALAYIPLTIFFVDALITLNAQKWIIANYAFQLVANLVLTFFLINTDKLPDKFNPYHKTNQVIEVAKYVSQLKSEHPEYTFATDDRKTYATLVYYTSPHMFDLKKYKPTADIKDHFDLNNKLSELTSNTVLISQYISCTTCKVLMEYGNIKILIISAPPVHLTD